MEGLTLLQDMVGKERRPLSWVVGDQGVVKPTMQCQRDIKTEERRSVVNLRSPDSM
jgi:NADH-quinone oxidoreductase subunit B